MLANKQDMLLVVDMARQKNNLSPSLVFNSTPAQSRG
jgi:dihydroflavonol-4-reductase